MNKFLETYNLSGLNHEVIENLNRPIISKEAESIIKIFPTNKSSGPDGFSGELYQTLKEELLTSLLKLFQKIKKEETFPNSSFETSIGLILKPDKNTTKEENYRLHIQTQIHIYLLLNWENMD